MMYYILRLADPESFYKAFKAIEDFLDVSKNENHVQITSTGGDTLSTMTTDYLELKGQIHVYANLILTGLFTVFILLYVKSFRKINNFDQTQDESYMMKCLSVFMVMTSTFLQMPVFISIFIIFKILALGLASKLAVLAILSNTVLILGFLLVLVYSLKFFNLEVPNDEIPWSHNQTSGIYLKVVLKVALCA
jgi:hypothetical protein